MSGRGVLDNLSSIITALVVAIFIWLLATQESHPMRTLGTFPSASEAGLPVTVRNVPAGQAAYDLAPRTVRLKLRGIDDALRELSPDDFTASVDLNDTSAEVESATLPVTVRCSGCARRGIRVIGWEPTEVTLSLAEAVSETRQVLAVPSDESPAGYTRGYDIKPSQLVLSGARPALARVRQVVAPLQMGADSSANRFPAVTVQALDADGEVVPDVVADPSAVDVAVVLKRREFEVAVKPEVRGVDAVANGFYLTSISVSPQFVQLEGPSELVQSIREGGAIPTLPLDLSGRSGDVQRRVGLVLPRGVTATNAADGVTVTVKLESLPGTISLDAPVIVTRLGPGLETVSITPDTVSVLVSGPRPLLEQLQPGQLQAIVDLDGLGPGQYRVVPKIEMPADIQERSVTPDEVEIVIRASGSATATPRTPR